MFVKVLRNLILHRVCWWPTCSFNIGLTELQRELVDVLFCTICTQALYKSNNKHFFGAVTVAKLRQSALVRNGMEKSKHIVHLTNYFNHKNKPREGFSFLYCCKTLLFISAVVTHAKILQ